MIATLIVSIALFQTPPPKTIELTPEVAAKLQEIAFQAAREGDLVTLKEFFNAGRPVNELNPRGDTLLIVAAYNGHAEAVALILKQKAVEVDAKNKMGLTALTAAAFKGQVEIAKSLVAAKADVNAANASGQTALMFASLAGRTKMVEYLLASGANPKAKDKSGNTPLTLAQGQDAHEVVTLLKEWEKKKK